MLPGGFGGRGQRGGRLRQRAEPLDPPGQVPLGPSGRASTEGREGGGGFAQGFFVGKLLFGHSPINTEPSWIVENPFPLTGRALTPHSLGQYPIFKEIVDSVQDVFFSNVGLFSKPSKDLYKFGSPTWYPTCKHGYNLTPRWGRTKLAHP